MTFKGVCLLLISDLVLNFRGAASSVAKRSSGPHTCPKKDIEVRLCNTITEAGHQAFEYRYPFSHLCRYLDWLLEVYFTQYKNERQADQYPQGMRESDTPLPLPQMARGPHFAGIHNLFLQNPDLECKISRGSMPPTPPDSQAPLVLA